MMISRRLLEQSEAMADSDDEEIESPRQNARRRRREAGHRSARVARALMGLHPSALRKLKLNEAIREATDRACATKSMTARHPVEPMRPCSGAPTRGGSD
jgi:ribosomal 50S subunit-associated protein YjgA (DUF615 family)